MPLDFSTLPQTPTIAVRNMVYTRLDGVTSPVVVTIGQPEIIPDAYELAGRYYATCRIDGVPGLTNSPDPNNPYWLDQSINSDPVLALFGSLAFPGPMLGVSIIANQIDFAILPNYGFPSYAGLTIPPTGSTVSGTVQLEGCNDPAQNLTFEFRTPGTSPYDPANPVPALQVIQQILTPTASDTGSFALPGVPDGTYDLAIKGFCWLRKVLPGVVVAGANVSGLSASLLGGDINNDNVVDTTDYNQFISDYGTQGDP